MAAVRAMILLAVCILVAQQASAFNVAPCQSNKNNNAHNEFLRRHNPPGSPTTLDKGQWEEFIKQQNLSGRPIQSFIRHEEKDELLKVCSAKGGKVHKNNLCISKDIFTFVTVTADKNTFKVKTVKEEKKHLILACDKVDNKCVPVHFEANENNVKPNDKGPDCKA